MNIERNEDEDVKFFTFIPQPIPGDAAPPFEDVYHEGTLIGCTQSSSSKNGWFAPTQPDDEPITSEKGRGLHYFDSKTDAAKRLLDIANIRKSIQVESC